MFDKYKRGMNEININEELRNRVINDIKLNINDNQSKVTKKINKKIFVFICVFSIILAFSSVCLFNYSSSTMKKSLQNVLIITVYAHNDNPTIAEPNVKFLLGKYSPAMSSVPGMPIKIESNNTNEIELSLTKGVFITWNSTDGTIISHGEKTIIRSGEIIYWSPLEDNSQYTAQESVITMKVIIDSKEITNSIIITSTDEYSYIGKLGNEKIKN